MKINIFKEYCSASIPTTPARSRLTYSLGNGKHIVGQELIYTCDTGYEFKTAVPAGSTNQGQIYLV